MLTDYIEKFSNQTFDIDVEGIEALGRIITVATKTAIEKPNIIFTGVGKTSYVAGYAAALISSVTNLRCFYLDTTEIAHGSAGAIQERDIVIFISNSGKTAEILRALEIVRTKGATTASITKNSANPLAEGVDYPIVASYSEEGGPWNLAPRLSINAQNTVIELLSIYLQVSMGFTKEEYQKNHQAGSIGAALSAELTK